MTALARPKHPPGSRHSSSPVGVLRAPQLSDPELVAWVIEGREGAAARLFDRFAPLINHVVMRVLGGDNEHDDLVHEAFLKIWQLIQAGRVQKPESLSSWVATVTTHVVYKDLRKRYVRRRFFGREEPPPAALASVPDHDAREGLRIVYAILGELPPDERLAFTLRHLGQHGLSQVAAMCDCSLATIKRRLTRAHQKFEARARAYPEFPRLMALVSEEAGG